MVIVGELRSEEERLAGHARRLDAFPDLGLIRVRSRGVDVLVPVLESELDGVLDLAGRGLPGPCNLIVRPPISMMSRRTQRTEPEHGHLRAGVELDGLVNWHCDPGLY